MRKVGRTLAILAVACAPWALAADDCPSTIVASPATVECATSRSGARLFTCAEREGALRAAGLRYETLGDLFSDGMEEHVMVKAAIDCTVAADLPDGRTRAMLWEELVARIDRKLGRPVSKSYHGDEAVFVFQGMKRFHGKAYLLVILPTGEVYSGPAEPLEDLGNWEVHREALSQKRVDR